MFLTFRIYHYVHTHYMIINYICSSFQRRNRFCIGFTFRAFIIVIQYLHLCCGQQQQSYLIYFSTVFDHISLKDNWRFCLEKAEEGKRIIKMGESILVHVKFDGFLSNIDDSSPPETIKVPVDVSWADFDLMVNNVPN